ncbi:alpha/beta fold hydrolase [Nesterenkonia haasae]|uniref:alpha/beta fold hydrolase n=1 Tax=Nesterenkonia haasae TaxID=2587813 RepID=UPI001390F192|nr:alpha/beta fold hydrolase [Nesterenkonia haasae]NDK31705.1 alpha/beta fold hydrolase [Nesterenkonia haasae]
MTVEATALQTLTAESFRLESGELLEAEIRYRTYGELSAAADNCVVIFSYYTGTDLSYLPWIGEGRPLDPKRYFIIIINHFGGGVSSSPSTTEGRFPPVSIADNAHAARMVLDDLGVEHVHLAAGWSLGGMQALEFAVRYPESVTGVLAVCSAARCEPVNRVFLGSVAAALEADPRFATHDPDDPPLAGLDAFGRVYAGWAYSASFFSHRIYQDFGFCSVDEVLDSWGRDHQAMEAQDLMASLKMWDSADIGTGRGGTEAALASIRARVILMPSTTDAYFTLEDNLSEAEHLAHGEVTPLESPLGHVAGRPGIHCSEQKKVDDALSALLE